MKLRNWFKLISCVIILAVATTLLPATLGGPQPAHAQVVDDEIIYIDNNGFIVVIDINQANDALVDWKSDEGGFTRFTKGDFNNDGDYEIAAIKGEGVNGKLIVYDPVVSSSNVSPTGETPNGIAWKRLADITIGFTPRIIGAGNMDDGIPGDEIIYGYETGTNQMEIVVIKGNSTAPDGTGWLQHIPSNGRGLAFARTWDFVAVGQVDGQGADEVILTDGSTIENVLKSELAAYRIDDGGLDNNSPFYRNTSSGNSWRGVAIGHVKKEGTQEVVALRRTSDNGPANILIFQYDTKEGLKDANGDAIFINPRPSRVMLADITGEVAGVKDKEMFFLRSVGDNVPNPIRLTVFNRGDDNISKDKIEQELDSDNGWQYGAGGDVDADGKDELIIMRPDKIRVYMDPNGSMDNTREFIVANNGKSIQVADLDKNGFSAGLEFEATLSGLEDGVEAGGTGSIQINLGSGSTPVPYTAEVVSKPEWITGISPVSGSTPANLSLSVDATNLLPGTYRTTVVIRTSNPDVVNNPLTLPIAIAVQPAQLIVLPASASFIYSSCEVPLDVRSIDLKMNGPPGLTYEANVFNIKDVSAAQALLAGPVVGASMRDDGLIELRDGSGNVSTLQGAPKTDVRASADEVPWNSYSPWIKAASEDGIVEDTMTVTVDPNIVISGTVDAVSVTSSAKSVIVLVVDPRAGDVESKQSIVTIPVTYLCAQSQLYLPITTSP